MKDSKPIYAIFDGDEFTAIVWETELGKIVTTQGKVNPQMDLVVKDIEKDYTVTNIDLRNILMQILPYKENGNDYTHETKRF